MWSPFVFSKSFIVSKKVGSSPDSRWDFDISGLASAWGQRREDKQVILSSVVCQYLKENSSTDFNLLLIGDNFISFKYFTSVHLITVDIFQSEEGVALNPASPDTCSCLTLSWIYCFACICSAVMQGEGTETDLHAVLSTSVTDVCVGTTVK